MTAVTSDPVVDEVPEPAESPVEKPVDREVAEQIASLALVPTQKTFTPDQLAVLEARGIKVRDIEGVNPAMLQGFLALCLYRGVNPFIGEATIMPTEDGWAAIMQIDGFRVMAERTGEYLGMTEPEWSGDDGEWRTVWPKAWGRPQAARIGVKRWRPSGVEITYGVVHTEEYEVYHYVEDTQRGRGFKNRVLTPRWEDGGQVKNLLIKCAKAAAFRDAFPRELDGFYSPEEMERLRRERREAEAQRDAAEARERRRIAYEEAQRAKNQPERVEPADPTEPPLEGVVVRHGGQPVSVETTMGAVRDLIDKAHAGNPAPPPESGGGAEGEAASVEEVPVSPPASEVPADLPLSEEQRVKCLHAELAEQAEILGQPVERLVARFAPIYEGDPLSTWDSAILLSIVAWWRKPVATKLERIGRWQEAMAYREAGAEHVDHLHVLFGRSMQPVGES